MAVPNQTGVKQPYIDHLTFDHTLQPIDETGGGVTRTAYEENVLGHRSGVNIAANQTNAKLQPVYGGFTTANLKPSFRSEQNRGNPNSF